MSNNGIIIIVFNIIIIPSLVSSKALMRLSWEFTETWGLVHKTLAVWYRG